MHLVRMLADDRKIDALGRLVLPAEARRALGIGEGSSVDIYLGGDEENPPDSREHFEQPLLLLWSRRTPPGGSQTAGISAKAAFRRRSDRPPGLCGGRPPPRGDHVACLNP